MCPRDGRWHGLAERLDQRVVESTGELIALHGLAGRASSEVLERLRSHYELDLAIDPGKASIVGAAITGALGVTRGRTCPQVA